MRFVASFWVKGFVAGCFLLTLNYIIQYRSDRILYAEMEEKCKQYQRHANVRNAEQSRTIIPTHGNVSTTCPVRDILEDLHGPKASTLTINTAIEELSHCKAIYFTRIPKCSTRTIFKLFKSIERTNRFKTVSWLHKTNPLPQSPDFLRNISNYPIPSIHGREAFYVNFTRSGFPLPIYTSVVRHPVDRLVSLYYFRIFGSGDNTAQQKSMMASNKHCVNTTIDDVVNSIDDKDMDKVKKLMYAGKKIHECWPKLAIQHHFFCDKYCWKSGLANRVDAAWKILMSDYLLVGISEELGSYMKCIEKLMPTFFQDVYKNYEKSESQLGSKFKTSTKKELKPKTKSKMEKLLDLDIQFYERATQRFHTLCDSYL